MDRAIVIRGRLDRPRHIELDEDVTEISGPVEVVLRPVAPNRSSGSRDVFELIATMGSGVRSKADIDRQVAEERASWGDR